MKKVFLLLFSITLIGALTGCGKKVSHDLSSAYRQYNPRTVAVLPIGASEVEPEVKTLFRDIVEQKLQERNYAVLPTELVDKKLIDKIEGEKLSITPAEAAKILKVDAVLYIKISTWDVKQIVTYAHLKLGGEFSLYAKDGTRLWRASHDTREGDVRFDKSQVELAVIKAYEPRIQRVLDEVFYTLPSIIVRTKKKEYFEWLE